MIMNFSNRAAQEIWETWASKAVPQEIWLRAKALMTIMHSTSTLEDLRIKGQPPSIRLHKLKGLTFRFKDGEFVDVKIENYHKG